MTECLHTRDRRIKESMQARVSKDGRKNRDVLNKNRYVLLQTPYPLPPENWRTPSYIPAPHWHTVARNGNLVLLGIFVNDRAIKCFTDL